jgi:hypothetical protein
MRKERVRLFQYLLFSKRNDDSWKHQYKREIHCACVERVLHDLEGLSFKFFHIFYLLFYSLSFTNSILTRLLRNPNISESMSQMHNYSVHWKQMFSINHVWLIVLYVALLQTKVIIVGFNFCYYKPEVYTQRHGDSRWCEVTLWSPM